jgi:hypothetical protein
MPAIQGDLGKLEVGAPILLSGTLIVRPRPRAWRARRPAGEGRGAAGLHEGAPQSTTRGRPRHRRACLGQLGPTTRGADGRLHGGLPGGRGGARHARQGQSECHGGGKLQGPWRLLSRDHRRHGGEAGARHDQCRPR